MRNLCKLTKCYRQTLIRCKGGLAAGHHNNSRSFASITMSTRTADLANTLLLGDDKDETLLQRRLALSRAITLIESQSLKHRDQADLLLNYVTRSRSMLHNAKSREADSGAKIKGKEVKRRSFRVGIAGAPGSGKSSFIEMFGNMLLDGLPVENTNSTCQTETETSMQPNKLAVICVDPSSSITGGSILGDKTRMTDLSRHPKAFVRPSPSKGVLGGLSSYTNDVVTLCEAAGYDLVFVETVGLGQSEVDISQVVDMLILIVPPGGGDGLQGVKKGILELADMIIVNKADGSLLPAARFTAADYKGATQFFRTRIEGWKTPPVLLASAETGEGIPEVWNTICRYRDIVTKSGDLQIRQTLQARYWLWKHVQELMMNRIRSDENIRIVANEVEDDLDRGLIAPRAAASKLFNLSKCTDEEQ